MVYGIKKGLKGGVFCRIYAVFKLKRDKIILFWHSQNRECTHTRGRGPSLLRRSCTKMEHEDETGFSGSFTGTSTDFGLS